MPAMNSLHHVDRLTLSPAVSLDRVDTPDSKEIGALKEGRTETAAGVIVWYSDKTIRERMSLNIQAHEITPRNQSGRAYSTTQRVLGELQIELDRERPGIQAEDWDFTLKDGKLIVTGNRLSEDDKAYLEAKLNGKAELVDAAKSMVAAAVSYTQASKDGPKWWLHNAYTGTQIDGEFHNVEKQLEGRIEFKKLFAEATKLMNPKGTSVVPESYYGGAALDVIATHLRPTVKASGMADYEAIAGL